MEERVTIHTDAVSPVVGRGLHPRHLSKLRPIGMRLDLSTHGRRPALPQQTKGMKIMRLLGISARNLC